MRSLVSFAALLVALGVSLPVRAQVVEAPPPRLLNPVVERLAVYGVHMGESSVVEATTVAMTDGLEVWVSPDGAFVLMDTANDDVVATGTVTFTRTRNGVSASVVTGGSQFLLQIDASNISRYGLFISGTAHVGALSRPISPMWLDTEVAHAAWDDAVSMGLQPDLTTVPVPDVIPSRGSRKECRCACAGGSSNGAGCTTENCRWQNPCSPNPCPQVQPTEGGEATEMMVAAQEAGTCRWMDPCPPDCGSVHVAILFGISSLVGAGYLRRRLSA